MSEEFANVPDVVDMPLDLTKDEKLRVTALMLAIKYYTDTIVSDGQLYQAMVSTGKVLAPATAMGVVDVACKFAAYLKNGEIRKEDEDPR